MNYPLIFNPFFRRFLKSLWREFEVDFFLECNNNSTYREPKRSYCEKRPFFYVVTSLFRSSRESKLSNVAAALKINSCSSAFFVIVVAYAMENINKPRFASPLYRIHRERERVSFDKFYRGALYLIFVIII